MENGKVLPLFEKLYLLITLTLLAMFLATFLPKHWKSDSLDQFQLYQICMKSCPSKLTSKTFTVNFAFAMAMTVLQIIMFSDIQMNFTRNVPSIFGNFQRNVVTFREYFLFQISSQIMDISAFAVFIMLTYIEVDCDNARIFLMVSLVSKFMFVGTILPSIILWNLSHKMPQFFIHAKLTMSSFYISRQILRPSHQARK